MAKYALVGDIGGTNARFALVQSGSTQLQQVRVLACADYSNLDSAVVAYLAQVGEQVEEACLAFACPVHADWIQMTNNHWCFSKAEMQSKLQLRTFKVLNDFTAMALGMPQVDASGLLQVGGGEGMAGRPRLVIGPGTGLGVSALVPSALGWIPLAAEGGHVSWPITSEWELQLWQHLKSLHSRISAERLLSGAGLLLLYQAYAVLRQQPCHLDSPAKVTEAALAATDPLAVEVLEHFCRVLGEVAGNAALTIGTLGGVYICGGIVPRFPEFFAKSGFRQAFEAKGRMQSYMEAMPVWLVNAEYPGLLGAAAGLANQAVS